MITRADLGLERRAVPRNTMELDQARDIAELNAIKTSLWYTQNNISQAAKELGVSRVTLYRLMGKHRLSGQHVR
ncbi:MAG: helix-turn-helix domain-containing protein [Burkholderiales bacterium]|nr:hypothetical protein [Pseudomonadota bacterium]